MHVNRTGAGFHRDSRREVRMSRAEAQRWAIEESVDEPDDVERSPSRSS